MNGERHLDIFILFSRLKKVYKKIVCKLLNHLCHQRFLKMLINKFVLKLKTIFKVLLLIILHYLFT